MEQGGDGKTSGKQARDESARAWALKSAGVFGDAVKKRREDIPLTASELADRTRALGYPITRAAISKIENNLRNGKLDLAEVIVLSAALEVPPVAMIYTGLPNTLQDVLPDREVPAWDALRWFTGEANGLPEGWDPLFDLATGDAGALAMRYEYKAPPIYQRPENDEYRLIELCREFTRELHAAYKSTSAASFLHNTDPEWFERFKEVVDAADKRLSKITDQLELLGANLEEEPLQTFDEDEDGEG
ncbi:helix-turn-helix domain-containing protein [Corynebacterium sp. CCM 9185]|uniref:Helix-turn-helix transcriptional regulator n=1 Tax=Corynebacterium marambiense TaxID=2765364 RepID=A0ABS0VUQ4_9CORY|nr:helix-turn-helix transcriptional regulator [Corynebacterium marambiense]MBI9000049.1 helix-turn-helix transcriptional regulator [Corynebacterium marambiense]MCK7663401.1 helix-turn-helix domain-containing protein [Corynebacterium marambiense]